MPLVSPTPDLKRFAPAEEQGSGFKIIPNSELVYGPASLLLDMNLYLKNKNGISKAIPKKWTGNFSAVPRLSPALRKITPSTRVYYLPCSNTKAAGSLKETVSENNNPCVIMLNGMQDFTVSLHGRANEFNRGYYLLGANAVSRVDARKRKPGRF